MIGKLLALDVGLARIGVAVCDPLQLAVRPVMVLERTSRRADFAQLAELVRTEEAVAVLCGLPLHMDDSESSQSQTVRKWAMRLAQALRTLLGQPVPILFWDERLSTFAAQEILAASHSSQYHSSPPTTSKTQAPMAEDAVAAAVILQSYLDAQRQGDPRDFGRIELPVKGDRG